MNRIEITGILIERQTLRYTPTGLPVAECLIGHASEQLEAGLSRHVECEIPAIALGETANWLQAASPGMTLRMTGFLAAKSRKSRQLRLHINTIEFVEGKQNGQVLQKEG